MYVSQKSLWYFFYNNDEIMIYHFLLANVILFNVCRFFNLNSHKINWAIKNLKKSEQNTLLYFPEQILISIPDTIPVNTLRGQLDLLCWYDHFPIHIRFSLQVSHLGINFVELKFMLMTFWALFPFRTAGVPIVPVEACAK